MSTQVTNNDNQKYTNSDKAECGDNGECHFVSGVVKIMEYLDSLGVDVEGDFLFRILPKIKKAREEKERLARKKSKDDLFLVNVERNSENNSAKSTVTKVEKSVGKILTNLNSQTEELKAVTPSLTNGSLIPVSTEKPFLQIHTKSNIETHRQDPSVSNISNNQPIKQINRNEAASPYKRPRTVFEKSSLNSDILPVIPFSQVIENKVQPIKSENNSRPITGMRLESVKNEIIKSSNGYLRPSTKVETESSQVSSFNEQRPPTKAEYPYIKPDVKASQFSNQPITRQPIHSEKASLRQESRPSRDKTPSSSQNRVSSQVRNSTRLDSMPNSSNPAQKTPEHEKIIPNTEVTAEISHPPSRPSSVVKSKPPKQEIHYPTPIFQMIEKKLVNIPNKLPRPDNTVQNTRVSHLPPIAHRPNRSDRKPIRSDQRQAIDDFVQSIESRPKSTVNKIEKSQLDRSFKQESIVQSPPDKHVHFSSENNVSVYNQDAAISSAISSITEILKSKQNKVATEKAVNEKPRESRERKQVKSKIRSKSAGPCSRASSSIKPIAPVVKEVTNERVVFEFSLPLPKRVSECQKKQTSQVEPVSKPSVQPILKNPIQNSEASSRKPPLPNNAKDINERINQNRNIIRELNKKVAEVNKKLEMHSNGKPSYQSNASVNNKQEPAPKPAQPSTANQTTPNSNTCTSNLNDSNPIYLKLTLNDKKPLIFSFLLSDLLASNQQNKPDLKIEATATTGLPQN